MSALPVRFGIMVDGPTIQAWQWRCVEEILALDGAEAALVIRNGTRTKGRLASLRSRLPLRHALFIIYSRLFVRPPATTRIRWRDRLGDVPEVICTPLRKGRVSDYFEDADIAAIRAHRLDFILRFGFGIVRGEALETARFGVWSFHHDDEQKYRGRPAAFWPIYEDDPVSGLILQRLTDRIDGGVILRRAYFATKLTSLAANVNQGLFGGAHLAAQVARDVQNACDGYLDAEPSTSSAPMRFRPTNAQMLRFIARLWRNRLRALCHRLFRYETWRIGIIDAPIASVLDNPPGGSVRWFPQLNARGYAADPFVARDDDGGVRVLYENFDYRGWKGDIAAVRLENGQPMRRGGEVALKKTNHLSYPYLFRQDGALYCIPENAESDEIVLYRADRPDGRLQRITTLVAGVRALDVTVVPFDGRWWMFHTDQRAGASDRLFVRYADTPFGPWTAHPQNPVKIDIRSARPAGTPFVHDGALYRPAQDCAETYGARIRVQRITTLTPTAFAEEEAAVITPDPDGPWPHGLHTISGDGNITVIDGKCEGFIWQAFAGAMRRRFRSLRRRHGTEQPGSGDGLLPARGHDQVSARGAP